MCTDSIQRIPHQIHLERQSNPVFGRLSREGRACIEETGVDFGSVRAAFGPGECTAALVLFSALTAIFLACNRWRVIGAEMTLLEGFMPVRALPLGNSLFRMVLIDCSTSWAFACTLRLGKGQKLGVTLSEDDLTGLGPLAKGLWAGWCSGATLGGAVESPGGAEGRSGFAELGFALGWVIWTCSGELRVSEAETFWMASGHAWGVFLFCRIDRSNSEWTVNRHVCGTQQWTQLGC